MNLEIETIRGIKVVRVLERRLNSKLASRFKAEFLVMIGQGNHNIVVNLEKVKHIDSSGLGSLLFGLRQAKANGGVLKLVGPQPNVLGLIKIARLESVFEIFEDEEKAISSFFREEENS